MQQKYPNIEYNYFLSVIIKKTYISNKNIEAGLQSFALYLLLINALIIFYIAIQPKDPKSPNLINSQCNETQKRNQIHVNIWLFLFHWWKTEDESIIKCLCIFFRLTNRFIEPQHFNLTIFGWFLQYFVLLWMWVTSPKIIDHCRLHKSGKYPGGNPAMMWKDSTQ